MKFLFAALSVFIFTIAFAPEASAQKAAKEVKQKVKRDKNKGAGSQEDLDAMNRDANQDKAYQEYMKEYKKKMKKKEKRQEVDRKRAAKKAERRRNKAAKRVKRNKNNYGANSKKGFPWIF